MSFGSVPLSAWENTAPISIALLLFCLQPHVIASSERLRQGVSPETPRVRQTHVGSTPRPDERFPARETRAQLSRDPGRSSSDVSIGVTRRIQWTRGRQSNICVRSRE